MILRAARTDTDSPFECPQRVNAIEGFVEAPALSPDEQALYYHLLEPETQRYAIYRVRR